MAQTPDSRGNNAAGNCNAAQKILQLLLFKQKICCKDQGTAINLLQHCNNQAVATKYNTKTIRRVSHSPCALNPMARPAPDPNLKPAP